MAQHGLDVTRLGEIFEALEGSPHKLTTWELDRLPEWKALWEAGNILSEKQLACLEKMYIKV